MRILQTLTRLFFHYVKIENTMENLDRKKIMIGLIAILGTFIFLLVVYQLINPPTIFPQMQQIKPSDHLTWSTKKQNILMEYSDFQCPACKNFHDSLKILTASQSATRSVTSKITLVFRNFPLYQIHPNSLQAAYAAEAAGQQGKYWQMNDKLFSQQEAWTDLSDPLPAFIRFAEALQCDIDQFKRDMQSQTVKDKVQADLSSGAEAGINATPTFFLNGKKIEISNLDEFQRLLLTVQ